GAGGRRQFEEPGPGDADEHGQQRQAAGHQQRGEGGGERDHGEQEREGGTQGSALGDCHGRSSQVVGSGLGPHRREVTVGRYSVQSTSDRWQRPTRLPATASRRAPPRLLHEPRTDLMITTAALSTARRATVRELLDAVTAHDGVSPLDEAAVLALDADDARHLLVEEEGELRGYAGVLPDGTVQGMVHPAHRRRGHGTALLQEALALRPAAGVWAHGALEGSLAFLTAAGL